jgi:hypothetical protein
MLDSLNEKIDSEQLGASRRAIIGEAKGIW